MKGTVVIDCFPDCAHRYRGDHAIVVVDVIRASTTVTTAISMGMRVFPVQTTDEAFVLASTLEEPLLVGELGGNIPYGFDLTNSPAQIASIADVHRPMIFISSSGSHLLRNSVGAEAVYIGCLRNISALASHISDRHQRVAILGAGTRGRFRREDQIGCAWIAQKLIGVGYEPETQLTKGYIARWNGASVEQVRDGDSAEYLRKSGQLHDLEFVVQHIDDLDVVPLLMNGELVMASGTVAKSLTAASIGT
jgi:2-phosphosulfolactate phosphatase